MTVLGDIHSIEALGVKIAAHLPVAQLSKVSTLSRHWRCMLDEASYWHASVCNDLPHFDLHALLQTGQVTKKGFVELVQGLQAVIVSGGGVGRVVLENWHQAKNLLAAVLRAQHRAAKHMADGGHAAQIIVGIFRFDVACASSNILALPLEWRKGQPPSGRQRQVQIGVDRVRMTDVASLDVGILWGQSKLSLCFPKPWSEPQANARGFEHADTGHFDPYLAVDIQAVSSTVRLSLLDVRIRADGNHSQGIGFSSVAGPPAATSSTLANGLLCVVAVRDTVPMTCAALSESRCSRSLHALQIDARY